MLFLQRFFDVFLPGAVARRSHDPQAFRLREVCVVKHHVASHLVRKLHRWIEIL